MSVLDSVIKIYKTVELVFMSTLNWKIWKITGIEQTLNLYRNYLLNSSHSTITNTSISIVIFCDSLNVIIIINSTQIFNCVTLF